MPRMRSLLFSFFLMLGAVISPWALGQKMTVGKVAFRNAGSLQWADLEAVAAFHAGEKVSVAEIQAAAQHLMDTGFFDDVKVDSAGPNTAPTIIFVLKPLPSSEMLAVGFENFVWLTDAELREAVHKTFPLFEGTLPENSNQLEAIDAALQDALAAKGVAQARVSHSLIQPTTAEPVHALSFRVSQPSVVIDQVPLAGEAPLETALSRMTGKLHNAPFVEGYAPDATPDLLLQPYLNAGFLDAKLTDAKVELGQATANRVKVDYAATVQHGEVYHVSQIQFAGTPLVTADAFAAAAKLHAGDVASRTQLLATTAPIDAAYHKQGYMDEYVDTGSTLDNAGHTVSYRLTVVPGEQYRLHSLSVVGLPPEARAQFDLAWTMKVGELYDAEYVRAFIVNNSAMQSLSRYTGSFQAAADPATHLVDLTVQFVPGRGAR